MKMKCMKKFTIVFVIIILVSVITPAAGVFSAAGPKLNLSKKYLYLNKKGADTYDFNIINLQKNWSCQWTSSNKKVAAVNSRNGLTTAVGIGSAKITAVITDKAGKEVGRLTGTVVVRDNIKELKITDTPVNDVLPVGASNDFDISFITVSKSEAKTTSIVKWSVDKEGASITDDGTFTAEKAGEYIITANAFQSEDKYVSWSADKKVNAACLLASDTYKVTAEAASIIPADTYTISEGIASVSSFAELKGALMDGNVKEIDVLEDFEIVEDITVTKNILIIERSIVNKGVLTIKADFTLGGVEIENQNKVIVSEGGLLGVYMTNFKNTAQVTVENGGTMDVDRGGNFNNSGMLTNEGKIIITDNGGALNNNGEGIIENNGTIDCTGYYNNHGLYKGTGTEPVGLE